tara:strand:- start:51 stop:659 length:609 start_codon:yes stop_codon:yes gene_type:complete
MKLYFTPGTCSLAAHIILCETGSNFELAEVDLATHTLENAEDYLKINPLGQVPSLQISEDFTLREGAVIARYIADQHPDQQLIPTAGSDARYLLEQWQNFIATELHKNFAPLFNPAFDHAARTAARQQLRGKYQWLDKHLAANSYLCGGQFSVADAYLFTVTRWAPTVDLDLSDCRQLALYMNRLQQRSSVQTALRTEGLSQ